MASPLRMERWALELALHVPWHIGPGDEVIVPARSFVASASCVVTVGAKPVFADVDPDSQTVNALTIAAAPTRRTRAIIVVHLAGWPAPMDEIMPLADAMGLSVIEDCAQAHGAMSERSPGRWFRAGCARSASAPTRSSRRAVRGDCLSCATTKRESAHGALKGSRQGACRMRPRRRETPGSSRWLHQVGRQQLPYDGDAGGNRPPAAGQTGSLGRRQEPQRDDPQSPSGCAAGHPHGVAASIDPERLLQILRVRPP